MHERRRTRITPVVLTAVVVLATGAIAAGCGDDSDAPATKDTGSMAKDDDAMAKDSDSMAKDDDAMTKDSDSMAKDDDAMAKDS